MYRPSPVARPAAAHAPVLPVRHARQNAHRIRVRKSGTRIGSIPTRLKMMCQRMTARASAASQAAAIGKRRSFRANSRPRPYTASTVAVPTAAATPRMTAGVSPNSRNARLVK